MCDVKGWVKMLAPYKYLEFSKVIVFTGERMDNIENVYECLEGVVENYDAIHDYLNDIKYDTSNSDETSLALIPEYWFCPKEQVEFIKTIMQRQKDFSITIVIFTASPYTVEAVEVMTRNLGLDTKFYLLKETGDLVSEYDIVEVKIENLEEIYKTFSDPFQTLENMRCEGE